MSQQEMHTFREMSVTIGARTHKIFLQDGFYERDSISDVIHTHKYAEVHLVPDGSVIYDVGGRVMTVRGGTMLVIPAGAYHSGKRCEPSSLRTAFQIDAEVAEPISLPVSRALLEELNSEIDRAAISEDYVGVGALITLLCRRFIRSEPIGAQRITDYGFLIHEFFAHRYAEDVGLGDLAELLHLSERQAERLVYKHAGGGFRDVMARARISVAERLIGEGQMSLGEISSYVGYRSYAGFWKAIKKYGPGASGKSEQE